MKTMNTSKVRTRIAPSPTGFLHLGTARTALYSWAFARHHGGEFILRIEDTDVERSTQDSVDQILQSLQWLGLNYDQGPIYQMQRLERYHQVVDQMLAAGTAYYCYCTPQELDAMREAQKAQGLKTRYDGRWRPEPGKTLPPIPVGVKPVVRFANPLSGAVAWNDLVKGPIRIENQEIDDLIILRPASDDADSNGKGVPTYNFAVVVDDWDMGITHVFRGDEHINNTPWQMNMYRALGAEVPEFGHCPIILGDDGLKLSKRRGAVSVTAYELDGYLPEAMLNYLARLGWSHGDEELFSLAQMVQWFDGTHLAKSPAQWDPAKLAWVNGQYIKQADNQRLASLVANQLKRCYGIDVDVTDRLAQICALFKDRCNTTVELAAWALLYFQAPHVSSELRSAHMTDDVVPALQTLAQGLSQCEWSAASIAACLKQVLGQYQLKMPQLAIPLRVLVCATPQTPSIDAVLSLFERQEILNRLKNL
jgi:glutamyl-tRNA synthetase